MLDFGPISSLMESSPCKDTSAQSYTDPQQNIGPFQNLSGAIHRSGLYPNLCSSVSEPILGTEHRFGPSQNLPGPIQLSEQLQNLNSSEQDSVLFKDASGTVLRTKYTNNPKSAQNISGPMQQSELFQNLTGPVQQTSVISKCMF